MSWRRMKNFAMILTLLILAFGEFAHAQFFTGPAASGAGGGGRASVDRGEASFLNPASVAFLQTYNASVFYGSSKHYLTGEQNDMAASISDGTPGNFVSGAFTYVRRRSDFSGGTSDTQQDMQISLAGYALKKLAFGIGAHRLTDQVSTIATGNEYTQTNGHVGLVYVPIAEIGIGFVAYDVLPGADSVPVVYRVIPTHALALNFVQEKQFRIRMDFVRPDTMNPGRRINVNAGVETMLTENFLYRAGWFWKETTDQSFFTTGFGFQGPRLSLEYGFQKDVRDSDNYRHIVDLWIVL